jgi:hypothetical protein
VRVLPSMMLPVIFASDRCNFRPGKALKQPRGRLIGTKRKKTL